MRENSTERLQGGIEVPAVVEINVEAVVGEPTAEVLGGIMELAQRKRWFNEGPGKLDIG